MAECTMDATESHAECHFNCECDNSSLSDPKYAQLKGILPDEYEYRLCSFSECPTSGGFTTTIRLPLRSKEEAKSWKKEFQECSKSTFRVSKTYPHVGEKVIFKEDLRCQHKTRTESSRLSSKNTKCSATMTISVKRIKKGRCRTKDAHLQRFSMIVNMNFIHKHPLNSADALRHRDVSEEVTKKFLTMFEAGHSPSSALELHKYDMQIDHQDDFIFASADRAKIPDLQWCYRLYHTTEERGGIREDLIAFVSKLATKVEHDPDTFKPAVKTFIKSASKLQTDSALISALNTFGKYSGLSHVINNNKKKMRIAGMKQIGVQPTAIARRKRAFSEFSIPFENTTYTHMT